ncbi:MAG: efflux RND transporter periplasmic adaptor subunit [Bacteroidales bacterium]|nr:efflux RND transporter periplasmic adaptor subunit [Bacteroidales bacterium]MDZ4203184.1 efflux RND transporter periplasmic adaptor subunit [Bacteroidales bacterium]
MKRITIFVLATIAILAVSCSSAKKEKPLAGTTESLQKKEMVLVMTLDYRKIARSVEYTATLQAYSEIHMTPATPGRIEAIYVEVGSHVSAGTVLVQMDRIQLQQAEVQLRTLETDFRRLDTLRNVGSIALQQYDQLKAQYDIAKTNVEFLLNNTRLKAPFSGVISGKYFEAGEMYSGAPIPQIGKAAIVSLIQMDRLKAMVPISEKYFPLIKNGMEATVSSDIYPDRTFKGRIFRIHPTIDAGSRSFNVEIAIENRDSVLRPGMFIRVTLNLDHVDALVVPAISVLKMQGSNERYMFVEENGMARRVSVLIGKRYDDYVEVISDKLKQGDRIIVSGQARLLDGMPVEVSNN